MKNLANSAIPVLIAFFLGSFIILAIGENPFTTYWILIKNSLFSAKGFANTLHYAAPMILTALAIAITFKANIFNMGVEGQFILGGFAAGIVGSQLSGCDPFVAKMLCLGTGALCGMLFAMLPALLKAYCHADEMVITLMLNYAMIKVLEFLATGPFREMGSGYVCTPTITDAAMFHRFGNSYLTMFFFLVLIVFIVMWFTMKRTKLGYEINAIGQNLRFSEGAGMRVQKKIILLMAISGALAGLGGAGYMCSEQFKYTLGFSGSPGIGWDGMLVSLLGGHNPVGILFAAIFYSVLKTGSDNINMYTDVPNEIVAIIQSLIILFLAIKLIDNQTGFVQTLKINRKQKRRLSVVRR